MREWMNGRFTEKEIIIEDRAYKVSDSATGRDAFLKEWPEDSSRANNEITVITGTDSPYMPGFICSFSENGRKYVAEEWVDGITLENYIDFRGSLSWEETALVTASVCDALSYLHWSRQGAIAYLDIKPSNIILRGKPAEDNFVVSLVDYESARRIKNVRDGGPSVTRLLGSCYYTAPEVIFGEVCVQSDIYSLGVLMYAMLTGKEGFPKLNSVRGKAQTVIKKCIEPDKDDRYPDVSELKNKLVAGKKRHERAEEKRPEPEEKRTFFRKTVVMVDGNTCFTAEMARTAANRMGLKTACFAISEKGQKNMDYYMKNACPGYDLVSENSYYPFIFDHKSLYLRNADEWHEKGLLYSAGENMSVGSYRLIMELPLRDDGDYAAFVSWCYANFDFVILNVLKSDNSSDVRKAMKVCSAVIATPESCVEDVESCFDYYENLADEGNIVMSKLRFVAWDYRENICPDEKLFEEIVGRDKYLGKIVFSEARTRKRNRLYNGKMNQERTEDTAGYVNIVDRLVG